MSAGMYGASQTGSAGQPIFTDDVSLQVFMEHLKRLVSPWVPLLLTLPTHLQLGRWCSDKLVGGPVFSNFTLSLWMFPRFNPRMFPILCTHL
jgi:hypothetical protein